MKKTPIVSLFVLILLGFLWISSNMLDLLSDESESLSTDEVALTEVYEPETTEEETISAIETETATETTTVVASEATTEAITETTTEAATSAETYTYTFRYQDLYDQHYEKHGDEFGNITKEEYLKIANDLFTSDEALRKTESDGDLLFYDVASNTFGVLSEDGYIRTCFKPDDGIAYWNRQ